MAKEQIDVSAERMKAELGQMVTALNAEGDHDLAQMAQAALVAVDSFLASCFDHGCETLYYSPEIEGDAGT